MPTGFAAFLCIALAPAALGFTTCDYLELTIMGVHCCALPPPAESSTRPTSEIGSNVPATAFR